MELIPNEYYEFSNDLETWYKRKLSFKRGRYVYATSRHEWAKGTIVEKYKFIRQVKND
jgi:hypothetical protein